MLSRPRLSLVIIGFLTMALSTALPISATADDRRVLDDVHTDAIALYLDENTLVVGTRADVAEGAGTRLDPGAVTFGVAEALRKTAPAASEYAFLGVPAGAPIWVIPQTYREGVLWAGWSTESLPRDGSITSTTIKLESFDGPGQLEIYINEVDGPQRVLSSTDPSLSTMTVPVGVHAHANWVFTQPGTYNFAISATATQSDGSVLPSVPQPYTFQVGDTTAPSSAPTVSATSTASASPTISPTTTPSASTAPIAEAPLATTAKTTTAETQTSTAVEECLPTTITRTINASEVDVVTEGHFDIGLVSDGQAAIRAKDDRSGTAKWVDPANFVFHLTDAASATVPSGGDYGFLGSGTVWMVPLSQKSGVPWLGWNTQHPTVAGHATGPVTITLDSVSGPGALAVYDLETLGSGVGTKYFGTADGFPRSTQVAVGASGVHVHAIWAFTKPGAYTVNLSMSGVIDGNPVSASSPFAFYVGSGDPRSAAQSRTVTEVVGRTASGEECELPAGVSSQVLAETGPEHTESVTTVAAGMSVLGASLAVFGLIGRPRRQTP